MKNFIRKFIRKFIRVNYQKIRVKIFLILSSNNNIKGTPKIVQPCLFLGLGSIKFGINTQIGYFPSPFFYSGNIHLEARSKESSIIIGNNVFINNNFVCISEDSVTIGDDVLIGTNVEIIDSDAHNIHPDFRKENSYKKSNININNNVWIGSNVRILKGVQIGKNSVIANSSVVTKNVPENVVVAGIPAKIIKYKINE